MFYSSDLVNIFPANNFQRISALAHQGGVTVILGVCVYCVCLLLQYLQAYWYYTKLFAGGSRFVCVYYCSTCYKAAAVRGGGGLLLQVPSIFEVVRSRGVAD